MSEGIDRERFSCTYANFVQAVRLVRELGVGEWMSKLDIKHEFRLCPVRPEQWNLLCFRWEGKYFVDQTPIRSQVVSI